MDGWGGRYSFLTSIESRRQGSNRASKTQQTHPKDVDVGNRKAICKRSKTLQWNRSSTAKSITGIQTNLSYSTQAILEPPPFRKFNGLFVFGFLESHASRILQECKAKLFTTNALTVARTRSQSRIFRPQLYGDTHGRRHTRTTCTRRHAHKLTKTQLDYLD